MSLPCISLVLPCYNEEAVLEQTYTRLVEVLGREEQDWELEILFVNDGSADRTLELLKQLREQDERVRFVSFSRNFGHQNALAAGLAYAGGDAVVVMDADLQDPPETVLSFIERWREGMHVVYGQRSRRLGESGFKRKSAEWFYRCLNLLSEIPIPRDTGDFRLIDRKVVEELKRMPEQDRFFRGMVPWVGFNQCAVAYERQARQAGESKYPLFSMIRFALDGISSFSIAPLRFATNLGFASIGLSMLGILYALFMRLLTSIWVPGWTFLVITLLFFSGVQLFSLGIIGEYVGRIYREVKGRPLYIVEESQGFASDKG